MLHVSACFASVAEIAIGLAVSATHRVVQVAARRVSGYPREEKVVHYDITSERICRCFELQKARPHERECQERNEYDTDDSYDGDLASLPCMLHTRRNEGISL